MPIKKIRNSLRSSNRSVLIVYLATLLLIFSAYITSYINSSYLEQYISTEEIGLVYTVGAALTILSFLFISRVLHKVGNYYVTLGLIAIDFIAVFGLVFADSLRVAIPLFIAHITVITLIFFNFDIFLEAVIGEQEHTTGSRRGLLLALSSFVGACTPLLSGHLVGESSEFTNAYLIAAVALLPIFTLVLILFRKFKQPKNQEVKVLSAMRSFWIDKNIRIVFLNNLLLWFFFCFSVIYVPLYLSTEMGFSWTTIGIILFGGQLAYVFFEYPIGRLADQYFGEKEMMIIGFVILSFSVGTFAFLTDSVWLWIIAMFISRIGASLVEVTTESYFFKHTNGSDGHVISFFRMANPVAYISGPLVASLALLYLPFNLMFVVFGLWFLPGALLTTSLEDTK